MNESLLQLHNEDLRSALTTFFAASARRNDDAEGSSLDQWRLANLEGVVVAKAYAMPPEMFNLFAKVRHWR